MRLPRIPRMSLVCLLALAGTAAAQQPQVRVAITPDVVPVGEPAEMRVTVLVPTWFTSPPTFPSFELANAITRLPPDSSYPTSARVGNETWSGIVRNYEVYPLAAATYRLDDLVLKVRYAHPDTRKPVAVDLSIPATELRAKVPDGALALDPYLSGTKLTLSLDVDGDTEALEIGDAVVLQYTAELNGLPAMFLPPLFEDPGMPGVSVYADEPVVSDDGTARRSEKVTLVFDAGGEFMLPAVSLDWWDSRNKVIRTASADALTIAVAGPPIPAAAIDTGPADSPPPIRLIAAVVAGLAFLLLFTPRIVRRMRAARQRRQESEEHAFKRLRHAFRSGDARTVHHELILWLERASPRSNLREFAAQYGDDSLRSQFDLLSRGLFQGGTEQADLRLLERNIERARSNFRRRSAQGRRIALPPLNP